MKVSDNSKNKVEELAMRFISNKPPICREHTPDGLPIDAPENVENISENHPAYKFEKIVKNISDQKDGETQVVQARVRAKLREIFAQKFYSNSDKRSCIECFEERKNSDDAISIRMELPDDWEF